MGEELSNTACPVMLRHVCNIEVITPLSSSLLTSLHIVHILTLDYCCRAIRPSYFANTYLDLCNCSLNSSPVQPPFSLVYQLFRLARSATSVNLIASALSRVSSCCTPLSPKTSATPSLNRFSSLWRPHQTPCRTSSEPNELHLPRLPYTRLSDTPPNSRHGLELGTKVSRSDRLELVDKAVCLVPGREDDAGFLDRLG